MIMPAYNDWPAEAAIIARLTGAYGELEFMMSLCVGHALGDRWKGVKVIFRARGERARIELADVLAKDFMKAKGFGPQYADALGGMRSCLSIRNRFSHCHWASLYNVGMYYVDLSDAASAGDKFAFKWKQATLPWLQSWERYFRYAHDCFIHIESALNAMIGGPRLLAFPMPPKQPPPAELDPLDQSILAMLPSGP